MCRRIGRGNFADVWLVLRDSDKAQFAAKVVCMEKLLIYKQKRNSHLSLTSEASVLMSLQHEGIIKLHLHFELNRQLYLIIDLMCGGDLLSSLLHDGRFSEIHAKRLVCQICAAVRYIHSQDIVHRDIKPDNILLTSRDRATSVAKISDFGLARQTTTSDDCKTFCGTYLYMAPEILCMSTCFQAGQPVGYSKQVDMWSTGVSMYMVLCAMPPFDDEFMYGQIVHGVYDFNGEEWSDVSSEAQYLVTKLMTCCAMTRFTSNEAVFYVNYTWNPAIAQ